MIYKTLVGLKGDLSEPVEIPEILAGKHEEDNKIIQGNDFVCEYNERHNTDGVSENDSEEKSEDENTRKFVQSSRPRNETSESRRVTFLLFLYIFLYNQLSCNVYVVN